MDARCPNCDEKAQVNEEMSEVKCGFCGYEDPFNEYMKKMEERVTCIIIDYQEKNEFNI